MRLTQRGGFRMFLRKAEWHSGTQVHSNWLENPPMNQKLASRKTLWLFYLLLVSMAVSVLHADTGQGKKLVPPQPWDAGTRPPNFEAPSTLTIKNDCKNAHSFSVTKKDADFLDLEFTQPVSVPPQSSATFPVKFHTDGMTPGIYSGVVTIKCLDCNEVPPCTQSPTELAPRIRILLRPETPASDGPPKTDGVPPPVTPPVTAPTPVKPDDPTTKHPPENPPPPTLTTETTNDKKGCCCIADSVKLLYLGPKHYPSRQETVWRTDENGDPVQVTRTSKPTFGDEFKIILVYEKQGHNEPGTPQSECVLQWLEKSDRPPSSNRDAGVKPDKEADIGITMGNYNHRNIEGGSTLGPWYDRAKHHDEKSCPLPKQTIELDDRPAVLYPDGENDYSRTLYFHIILSSGANCPGKKELWAKQVLKSDPHDPGNKFYVSNDGGATWTPATK
jgi:hypothetical protein